MPYIEAVSSFIGSFLTPALLLISAFILIPRILSKKRLLHRTQKSKNKKDSISLKSSVKSLILALAGTLGVGNITGVASALISGGAGAIFWMWAGSLAVMFVKYAEVFLAMKFRNRDENGKFFGGTMYYIREGLGKKIGNRKFSRSLGVFFALMCTVNSLVTGNIIQSNAASYALSEDFRPIFGVILAALVLLAIIFGIKKIGKITALIIPPLAAIYVMISLFIIIGNFSLVPNIFRDIFTSAFSPSAIRGGAVGFSVKEAVRFGLMRGIFSNESGCGTSPTAHASSENPSPHSQALLGVAEVVIDTPVLCTLTALVMLIADSSFSCIPFHSSADPVGVTLDVFTLFGGNTLGNLISAAIILFAYSSIIAQIYYGEAALTFISAKKLPRFIYLALSVVTASLGGMISSPDALWLTADIVLGSMTAVNCLVLIILRHELDSEKR